MKENIRASYDDFEPPRLRFDTQEDALNFARQIVEDGNRWLSNKQLDFAELYIQEKVELVVKLGAFGLNRRKCDLIFASVRDGLRVRDTRVKSGVPIRSTDADSDRNELNVLISDTYLVESPEKVIPSLVRLECAKEREDVLWNVLGPPWRASFPFGQASTNREGGVFEPSITRSERNAVGSVIQRGPKIVDGIGGNVGEEFRQRHELEPMKLFVGNIRIWLDKYVVWFCVREGFNLPFEILDVMLCARQLPACALERI